MTPRPFILLDRDGTINVEREYLSRPDQVELLPEAAHGLRHMQALGFGLVVVTNQSGVGRGFFNESSLAEIHNRLSNLLLAETVRLDGIYYCPHTPHDQCICRKPLTGLVEMAARNLHFDSRQCVVIGDKPCDIELGRNLHATTVLVRTGYGADIAKDTTLRPDYVADNLYEAALLIQSKLVRGDGS
jgi:histidinol-phosphate phosphatase family protein